MADAGDDASSTGSNDAVVTEEEIRSMFSGEEAGPSVQKLTGPNLSLEELLTPLGFERDPAILDALLKAGRWLDAAEHVAKALVLHKSAPHPGIGPADDMLDEHPELIVLLRRQHALELLAEGKREQAQEYYNYSILGPAHRTRRTPHLDDQLFGLGETIAAAVAAGGKQPAAALPLDLPAERRMTCRNVRDYLRVYFPEFGRFARDAAAVAASRDELYAAAPFGEVVGEKQYRCLVCHQMLSFRNVPDQRLTEHLHDYCPAVTPAIRSRLPRRNRPPWHAPSSQAQAKRRRHK